MLERRISEADVRAALSQEAEAARPSTRGSTVVRRGFDTQARILSVVVDPENDVVVTVYRS